MSGSLTDCPYDNQMYAPSRYSWASLVVQMVKNLPAMQDTWIWVLGREDPLEKGMATHSSIPACSIPWTEETGGLSPWCPKESDTAEQLTPALFTGYG